MNPRNPPPPPQIGNWLANSDPAQLAKAHAAIAAAQPDANDLLLAEMKRENERYSYRIIGMYISFQIVYRTVSIFYTFLFHTSPGHAMDFERLPVVVPIAIAVYIPLMMGFARTVLGPSRARSSAIVETLVQRGELRVVPYLLRVFLLPTSKANDNVAVENSLIRLCQNVEPGRLPLSENPKTSDPAATLREKFKSLTRVKKGARFFTPAATQTPQRVQTWLALLPHLVADPNPKSLAVLANLLVARAQTLDEELLQNSARALMHQSPTARTANEPTKTAEDTPSAVWKPAPTDDATHRSCKGGDSQP